MAKKKLENKLLTSFIFVLFLGIFISLTMSCIIIFLFRERATNYSDISKILKEHENQKKKPIVSSIQDILFIKFQLIMNTLTNIRDEYVSSANNLNYDIETMKNYIKKYSYNGALLGDVQNKKRKEAIIHALKDDIDIKIKSVWAINPNITSIDDLDNVKDFDTIRAIYQSINLNIILKSNYELFDNSADFVDLFFVANEKYKTFVEFPFYHGDVKTIEDTEKDTFKHGYYEYFKKRLNNRWCLDENNNIPSYYYFFCRDWFRTCYSFWEKNPNTDLAISTPYIFVQDKKLGVSSCIKLKDPKDPNYEQNKEQPLIDNVLICADQILTSEIEAFDYYNSKLRGKFFINRVLNNIPIYYPKVDKQINLIPIIRLDFSDIREFYFNEFYKFELISSNFTSANNVLANQRNYLSYNQTFFRNGTKFSIEIYPVGLNLDKSDILSHVFNIIYITQEDFFKIDNNQFKEISLFKIIFMMFIMFIFALIIIITSMYLIILIAKQIVAPIVNLKEMLEDMSGAGENVTKVRNFSQKITIDAKQFSFKLNNDIEKNKSQEYETIPTSDDENEDEKEEIEIIENRSEDIEQLFQTLIKIKYLNSFAKTKMLSSEDNLLEYCYSKSTFNEFSNRQGVYLCDSNIANISLELNMFDKAILHFQNSLSDGIVLVKKILTHNNLLKKSNSLNKNLKELFEGGNDNEIELEDEKGNKEMNNLDKKALQLAKNNNDNKAINLNYKNINVDADYIKTILLDSRYPKIIVGFKQYFKSLNKFIKHYSKDQDEMNLKSEMSLINKSVIRESIEDTNMEFDLNYFIIKSQHNLMKFEEILIDYLRLSSCSVFNIIYKVEALLEYLEFLIKYKLRIDNDRNVKMIIYGKNENVKEEVKEKVDIVKKQEHLLDADKKRKKRFKLQTNVNVTEKILKDSYPNINSEIVEFKLETFMTIYELMMKYDESIHELRSKITFDHMKYYVDLKKGVDKNNGMKVMTPIPILIQRYQYLKGQLAYVCHEDVDALYHFQISKKLGIISDAEIICKSIKKIGKIIKRNLKSYSEMKIEDISSKMKKDKENKHKIFNERLNKEGLVDNKNNVSKAIVPDKSIKEGKSIVENDGKSKIISDKNKEVKEIKEKIFTEVSKQKRIKAVEDILDKLYLEEDQFKSIKRDIVLLINYSTLIDKKKRLQVEKAVSDIYEDIIGVNEKFCIFIYEKDLYNYLSITNKTPHNYNFCWELIQNMSEFSLENENYEIIIEKNVKNVKDENADNNNKSKNNISKNNISSSNLSINKSKSKSKSKNKKVNKMIFDKIEENDVINELDEYEGIMKKPDNVGNPIEDEEKESENKKNALIRNNKRASTINVTNKNVSTNSLKKMEEQLEEKLEEKSVINSKFKSIMNHTNHINTNSTNSNTNLNNNQNNDHFSFKRNDRHQNTTVLKSDSMKINHSSTILGDFKRSVDVKFVLEEAENLGYGHSKLNKFIDYIKRYIEKKNVETNELEERMTWILVLTDVINISEVENNFTAIQKKKDDFLKEEQQIVNNIIKKKFTKGVDVEEIKKKDDEVKKDGIIFLKVKSTNLINDAEKNNVEIERDIVEEDVKIYEEFFNFKTSNFTECSNITQIKDSLWTLSKIDNVKKFPMEFYQN